MRLRLWMMNSLLGICLLAGHAHASPESIDPTKKYLFFLHDEIIETTGDPKHRKPHGQYKYDDLREKIEASGFIVRSEARPSGADIFKYAKDISAQIATLLDAGVPAHNIGVVGSSKGGRIALLVSTLVDSQDVRYAILSGCLDEDIERFGLRPNGRLLSLLNASDDRYGSCVGVFMAGRETLSAKEMVLSEGVGKGLFYKPRSVWLKPMVDWINQ